ncbi:hypothetical protein SAMN05446037_10607 [Anaerovirgula multivorans]|uniref:Nucleotidyltransferase substrate binding protein, HI0074 family n=1 Tax=Anaerovirgula multivorans TaxID=312168 RepID=A0A239L2X8_9FIRM|nr:HepT-like ribonuclease domain-containing protein [Anaerovirgula multivorans]SNT24163.1 hypothetical protein SAMN05446037_10607 [Anaerovirgula multivorans]
MTRDEEQLLIEELYLLDNSNQMLRYSYRECKKIGIKTAYTFEELDKFEALTSRFARTSDLIIQKIFRLIDIIELEKPGSIIDRINRAEKRGLICSAETFKDIRRLRNDIAHEYIPTAIEEIFKKVLKLTPDIIDSVEKIKKYCQ